MSRTFKPRLSSRGVREHPKNERPVTHRFFDFVKDAPNLQALFEKAKKQRVELSLVAITGGVNLKPLSNYEDYTVVQTVMQPGVIGKSRILIYPHGASIGYELGFQEKAR